MSMTEMSRTGTPKEWARLYYRLGWAVIPLKASSKVPNLPKGHGLFQRRSTRDELRSFSWEGGGVVTGSLLGIVVLDVDGEEGMTTLKDHDFTTPLGRKSWDERRSPA